MQEITQQIHDYLKHDIQHVDAQMQKLSQSSVALIEDVASKVLGSGGKKLRPMLFLLACKICNINLTEQHYSIAASIEYIHNATLLHDDVIDHSLKRRGLDTTNAIFGNKVSILMGDFLFARAFNTMIKSESLKVIDIISKVSTILAEGELLQLSHLKKLNIPLEDHIKISACKTGSLFAASTSMASVLNEEFQSFEQNFYDYGLNFGIAFQLADDILDYRRAKMKNKASKNAGDDFFEGKITLPLLLAYQKSSHDQQSTIEHMIDKKKRTQKDFAYILQLLEDKNTLHESIEMATFYEKKAQEALVSLPDHPAKNYLCDLAHFSIQRAQEV